MTEERFILAGLKRGDIKIFENIFHRYYPGLCNYAESLVKEEGLPEEIVQDVFYNVWKIHAELNITVSLKSYLYKAVFNQCMMNLRKIKHETRLDEKWAVQQVSGYAGPDEEMEEKEINSRMSKALDRLPGRTRQIFTMNRMEGFKYKDIAEKLSISIKTVEANMGKALKALRTSLNELSSF